MQTSKRRAATTTGTQVPGPFTMTNSGRSRYLPIPWLVAQDSSYEKSCFIQCMSLRLESSTYSFMHFCKFQKPPKGNASLIFLSNYAYFLCRTPKDPLSRSTAFEHIWARSCAGRHEVHTVEESLHRRPKTQKKLCFVSGS